MSQPLLEGHSETEEAVRLRREIAGLEQELEDAKEEARVAKQASKDAIQAIASLRHNLEPLYKSLKMIFGEISRVDAESVTSSFSGNTSVWQERMAKARSSHRRVLQVLLDGGGDMSLQQVRKAAGTSSNTSTYLNELIAKNWVQKTGHGMYSLKEL